MVTEEQYCQNILLYEDNWAFHKFTTYDKSSHTVK